MSTTFPPPESGPDKLAQAKERVTALFEAADGARHQAHEAAAALERGDLKTAVACLEEAELVAGLVPARHRWALETTFALAVESELPGG